MNKPLAGRSYFKTSFAGIAAVALVTLGGVVCVDAASIGVNFYQEGTPTSLDATASAGVAGYAQTNYNNVDAIATNLVLNDNSGNATTATLTTTGAIDFSWFVPPAGDDECLNAAGAKAPSIWSFTLNNIPYANYSIIVYDLDNSANAAKNVTLGITTFYGTSPSSINSAGFVDANFSTPFSFTQATSTNASAPTANSDYVMFTGLTGNSQTISIAGTGWRVVGGFQIVQTVPEPTSFALMGLGATGLAALRRKMARK